VAALIAEKLGANCIEVGGYLMSGLSSLASRAPGAITDVRGAGLYGRRSPSLCPLPADRQRQGCLRARALFLNSIGPRNILVFLPAAR